MALRRRLALVSAAAVAVAILLVSLTCYLVVRGQLRGQVDDALKAQAIRLDQFGFRALDERDLPGLPPQAGGPAQYAQVIAADGTVRLRIGDTALPLDPGTRSVAAGRAGSRLVDLRVSGGHLRVLSVAVPGGAVQLARPLDGVDRILFHVRLILALLCAGGIALAAALGRLAARRVLAPLAEVAQAALHIGETEDLTRRIAVRADDEVGQLATRFNAMLDRLQRSRSALDESARAQRQLVADASHELRTPVTSLRTNIEVLLEDGAVSLSHEERRRLLNDVVEQTEELSALVGDLIELARGDQPSDTAEDVRLDWIVAESVTRGRRNAPGLELRMELTPALVDGVPERLGRAVNNLIDNAARHSPPGATVEVALDRDGVRVRDHGPGIAPADLPHVFDRFFRGESARSTQGSGLGLAIVRQVAEQHGGRVSAANAPGGGAVFRLRLPVTEVVGADQLGRAVAPSSARAPSARASGIP